MLFSQRKEYKSFSNNIQHDDMSKELRTSLWNALDIVVWQSENFQYNLYTSNEPRINEYCRILWMGYFKEPIDSQPKFGSDILPWIRKYFFSCEWYEVYDFLEFSLRYLDDKFVIDTINAVLKKEFSAYRFVGGVFTEISDEEEIQIIEEVATDKDFPGVASHLKRALELLSDRENPDYRNSIKESISAVESLARYITGEPKATLGDALKYLKSKVKIHPALLDAYGKLYGYTSDSDGIRHAMLDEPDLKFHDAKFFLVICTSFVYYIKSKLE